MSQETYFVQCPQEVDQYLDICNDLELDEIKEEKSNYSNFSGSVSKNGTP